MHPFRIIVFYKTVEGRIGISTSVVVADNIKQARFKAISYHTDFVVENLVGIGDSCIKPDYEGDLLELAVQGLLEAPV